MSTRIVSGFMLMYLAASLLVSHVVVFMVFLSGADRDCKKGGTPDVEVKKGSRFFHVLRAGAGAASGNYRNLHLRSQ